MHQKRERYTSGEKALTKEEWGKLISCVDNLEDEILFKLLISTGIRREDACHSPKRKTGIRTEDIKELPNGTGTISFLEHKKNRIHTVPISKSLVRLIKMLINSRDKYAEHWLITYSGRTAHRRLQKYCDLADIPRRPIHALRATCVKFCQAAGWRVEEVSKLTGDTIAVIQEHYSTPSDAEMLQTVEDKEII